MSEPAIENQHLVDTRTAAEMLGLAPSSLELMRAEKRGPAYYKVGRSVRYAIEDLNAYVERVDP